MSDAVTVLCVYFVSDVCRVCFFSVFFLFFFFFKQKTAYEMLRSLVGSEMCIRDRTISEFIKDQYVEAGFPETHIDVGYLGIDTSLYPPRAGPHSGDNLSLIHI